MILPVGAVRCFRHTKDFIGIPCADLWDPIRNGLNESRKSIISYYIWSENLKGLSSSRVYSRYVS